MSVLSFQEMYNIAKKCDNKYDGKFFVAVKTTKIFCIPSCKAKFPLPQNLEFFETKEEALNAGYRGCRRCYSGDWPFNEPPWLKDIVLFLQKNSNRKVNPDELTTLAKVDQTTIRRYFKKKYNQSLMDYHRSLRLNQAKRLLQISSLPEVSKASGFKSVKGFKSAYYKMFGEYPTSIVNEKNTEEIV